jgi:hypothetical protein
VEPLPNSQPDYEFWRNKVSLDKSIPTDSGEVDHLDIADTRVSYTLDKEVFARFCELVRISSEYIFEYLYDKGKNDCVSTKKDIMLMRSLAILLSLRGAPRGMPKHIVVILKDTGITQAKLSRYMRQYRKHILEQYGVKL